MPDANEIYTSSISRLPPAERLRLATLILNGLTHVPASPPRRSILEILDSRPPGSGLFKTSAEVDEYLRQERDSWER